MVGEMPFRACHLSSLMRLLSGAAFWTTLLLPYWQKIINRQEKLCPRKITKRLAYSLFAEYQCSPYHVKAVKVILKNFPRNNLEIN